MQISKNQGQVLFVQILVLVGVVMIFTNTNLDLSGKSRRVLFLLNCTTTMSGQRDWPPPIPAWYKNSYGQFGLGDSKLSKMSSTALQRNFLSLSLTVPFDKHRSEGLCGPTLASWPLCSSPFFPNLLKIHLPDVFLKNTNQCTYL